MEDEAMVLAVILLLLVILIIICVVFQKQDQVISSVTASNSSDMQAEVLRLVNNVRSTGATCGKVYKAPAPPLQWNDQLADAAMGHSRDMADKNYFTHNSLDGRSFVNRIIDSGYTDYITLGENIAAGYDNPDSVVSGWMTSPGHCNNIMNPEFINLGVGYAYNSGSQYKHYWTQDFGTKL